MDEGEIDIRGIIKLLRRRIRLIAATLAVVLAIAVLALVAITPVYTASTLIFVDPSRKNLMEAEAAVTSSSDSARVDSEVEILRSDAVLLSVIESQDLLSDPEFGPRLGTTSRILAFFRLADANPPSGQEAVQGTLAKLRNAVAVQRRGLTYLITASVSSVSPQRAATVANAIAVAYINEQLRSKVTGVLASQQVLSSRLTQASQLLAGSEQAFDDFIAGVIEQSAATATDGELALLQAELEQLTQERDQLEVSAQQLEASISERDWSGLVAALQSEAVNVLETQRQQLITQLQGADAASPASVDLRAELDRIQTEMQMQAQTTLADLQATLPTLQSDAASIRQQLRTNVMSSNLPVDVLTRLYELQQSAELARAQYQTLLSRNSDLQVQADLQIADSRVVSPALAPLGASFPNSRLMLLLAGLAGLGLGVGLAFLYENYLGGFTTEEQIASVMKLPVLGEIPRYKQALPQGANSVADLMSLSPLSIFSESVRRIRSGIDQALRHRTGATAGPSTKRIMVTSTAPNEGKSTISLALARAYALSGKRTLLIDCDMRKPSIHRHLDVQQEHGLLDLLTGDANDPQALLHWEEATGLCYILGSRAADIPTDQLILGDEFKRLMRGTDSFDIVIIDTPPVGPVVDAVHIAEYADAVVFVMRWSSTSQSEAKSAVARLVDGLDNGVPVLAVLNQQEGHGAGYYRRYSSYYTETGSLQGNRSAA
jgi:succinoglycan biosynthesis transport protein ExoP